MAAAKRKPAAKKPAAKAKKPAVKKPAAKKCGAVLNPTRRPPHWSPRRSPAKKAASPKKPAAKSPKKPVRPHVPLSVVAPSTFSLRTGREEVSSEARGQARREEVRSCVEYVT